MIDLPIKRRPWLLAALLAIVIVAPPAGLRDGERVQIGPFDVEFIPVTHSVPHAHAIALHTPQGVIVHSGDFKIDLTPVDERRTDLARLGALAAGDGIRLLMLDSTNAEERGSAPSERSVGVVLRQYHEIRSSFCGVVGMSGFHVLDDGSSQYAPSTLYMFGAQ